MPGGFPGGEKRDRRPVLAHASDARMTGFPGASDLFWLVECKKWNHSTKKVDKRGATGQPGICGGPAREACSLGTLVLGRLLLFLVEAEKENRHAAPLPCGCDSK